MMGRPHLKRFGNIVLMVAAVMFLANHFFVVRPPPSCVHNDDKTPSAAVDTPPPPWLASGKVAILYINFNQDPVLTPLAPYTLGNALALLPEDWAVQVHSQRALPKAISLHYGEALRSGRLTYVNLREVQQSDKAAYLKGKAWAYTDPEWWKLIKAEHVLMLDQTATLCSGADHGIDDFLAYDWVGAPWKWAKPSQPFFHGGNGALSLRRKSALLRVLEVEKYTGQGNEDMFFVDRMVKLNASGKAGTFRLSDREVGVQFSVEEMFYEAPFGVSYSMRTVPNSNRNKILENCPEARVLVGYLPGADWLSKPGLCKDVKTKEPEPPCPWQDE